jgi:hypothetical protein
VKNRRCLMWSVLRLGNDGAPRSSSFGTGVFGVGVVEFLCPCTTRLIESELLVTCGELNNDDSGWVLCVGLSLSRLFVRSV